MTRTRGHALGWMAKLWAFLGGWRPGPLPSPCRRTGPSPGGVEVHTAHGGEQMTSGWPAYPSQGYGEVERQAVE